MPRNGSGVYSLPAGNPVVTGTTISSTVQNNTTSDIATALTQSIATDGQSLITANIPMAGFTFTGLDDAAGAGQPLVYGQNMGSLDGLTLTDPLVMSGAAINEAQGADIASASTINLTTATGNYVHITGTTAITAITLAQGEERTTVNDGILVWTNGASLILPGGANITSAAGDTQTWRGEASSVVRCIAYTKKSGLPIVSASQALIGGQCKLSAPTTTSLKIVPYNGSVLTINGANESIPSAGVTLAAAPGAANTTYYIYAYMNTGTMTLEASATGWSFSATAGNIGTPIKTGDDTRTLVGMARGNGSTQWVNSTSQRFVLNYWNRRHLDLTGTITSTAYSGSSYGEILAAAETQFLSWADEAVQASVSGSYSAGTAGASYNQAIGIDSTSSAQAGVCTNNDAAAGQAGSLHPVSLTYNGTLTEGYHFATILALHSGAVSGTYSNTSLRTVVIG